MKKEEKVIKYYLLCNQLKDVLRSGWKKWNVNKERLESVAEHIFGVQMLAIAMYSEYEYKNIDLRKVILMLAIHELEEITIGDKCWFEITDKDKKEQGHIAVKKLLGDLIVGEELVSLIVEFDERESEEAKFAYYCDKLECDLQAKLYDEEGRVDINDQNDNPAMKEEIVNHLLDSEGSWSGYWLEFDKRRCSFDKNFESILDYAKNNEISNLIPNEK